MRILESIISAAMLVSVALPAGGADILTPVIDGSPWQVAGDPDLGAYTRAEQQPVDFGVWQASDGTWQLWSCIRRTGCGGHTRLFHRWEGQHLTDKDWKPMGIAMEADPKLGETRGGLQAPHVVRYEGLYYMAYGDWENICFATSRDGKTFERIIQSNGKTGCFTEGPGANTRDPMLVRINGLWHCYYTAFPNKCGYGFCRTSSDLKSWSDSCVVSYGGQPGPEACQNECPFVVEIEPGNFYYFRNQFYGSRARNWVYQSRNPLNFGIDDDSKIVSSWRLAAPEIIRHEGQWYLASLLDSLKGIQIARLKWVRLPEFGKAVFDLQSPAVRDAWKLKSGDLRSVFTRSQRSGFHPPQEYFIATAEDVDGRFDDNRTGVIESPCFLLEADSYSLFVSGGDDAEKLFVSLIEADSGKELARWSGKRQNRLERIEAETSRWRGKEVFLRIVDRASGPWGHVNFGGLYANASKPSQK